MSLKVAAGEGNKGNKFFIDFYISTHVDDDEEFRLVHYQSDHLEELLRVDVVL